MKISEKSAAVTHGVLLIALFSLAAFYISGFAWVKYLNFSPLIVGILLGMLYANSLRSHLPDTWVPGIKFCSKQLLRLGIILYGFRLTFQQVMDIGGSAILVDTIIMIGTMGVGILAGKQLRMDSDTSLMVSTGSAVCGAAAVLGAEPVVKCQPYKTAIAVSTVVIFGTLSMFLYPVAWRAGWIGLTDQQMAVYVGSTLHEVAHVVGAGNAVDPDGALAIAGSATITKMIRVMMLAPLLLVMGLCLSRRGKGKAQGKMKISVPWFAFLFLAVIGLNSLLTNYNVISEQGYGLINNFDTFLLTMAMTALGAETSFEKFKHAGAKPFVLAGIIYVWLVVGGFFLCKWLV